jgi:hypothetical protein
VGPLPLRLLSYTAVDGELVPAWLDDRDRPWLRDLLHEAATACGRPVGELARRWRTADPDPRAGRRAAVAQHVVLALLRRAAEVPAGGPRLRAALFAAASSGQARDQALAAVAAAFATTPDDVLAQLFADLPHERRLRWPNPPLGPGHVLLAANLALAQGLLRRATAATLRLRGASRAVLRTAWLHGAYFRVRSFDGECGELTWRPGPVGPRRPHGLAAITPVLPWVQRYELRAHCQLANTQGTVVLATGDPLLPGPEPRRFDSALERAFARDFAALAPDWQVLREPVPLAVGDGLAFPDFELRHAATGQRWLLEIAGLRDRKALARKVELLAAHPRLVLCVPGRGLGAELAAHPRVLPFGRRIDPVQVLAKCSGPAP